MSVSVRAFLIARHLSPDTGVCFVFVFRILYLVLGRVRAGCKDNLFYTRTRKEGNIVAEREIL